MGIIPSLSQAVDFATTDESSDSNQKSGAKGRPLVPWSKRLPHTFAKPDKVFVASGRGMAGAVTEYRYGFQANIALDVDYKVPIREAWVFPAHLSSPNHGLHVLLSLPDRSATLYLSENLSQVEDLDSEAVEYDLTSRTIAAAQSPGHIIVQVSEKCLVLLNGIQR